MPAIDLTSITHAPTTVDGGDIGTTLTEVILPRAACKVTLKCAAAWYIAAADGLADGDALPGSAFGLAADVGYEVVCGVRGDESTLSARSSVFVAAASGTPALSILVEVR